MEPVRLVIWDLDGVFWRGTLAEEGIVPRPDVHSIVKLLAKRGIISSICSKNDETTARTRLEELGMWDYFVFPSLSWAAKGARVAEIIRAAQLRPASVLFIDDLPGNLAEASEAAPGLQVAGPDILPQLLENPWLFGKPDPELSRLHHYKLLEQRVEAATGDNLAFLRASAIRVVIDYDVEAQLDRAVELVNRTNQLNFTKTRLPEDPAAAREGLRAAVRDFGVLAGLVRVADRFGDHGIVGLFVLRPGEAILHFCFSCRVMGMGVEQYIYARLGRPPLTVVGPVAAALETPSVDWITEAAPDGTPQPPPLLDRIVLRGGCDLSSMAHYLAPLTREIIGEYNTGRHGRQFRIDHALFLPLALHPPQNTAALEAIGYTQADWTSALAQPPPAGGRELWLFSFWTDGFIQLYRHFETGITVPFLTEDDVRARTDLTALPEAEVAGFNQSPQSRAELDALRREFVGVGTLDEAGLHQAVGAVLAAARNRAVCVFVALPEAWRHTQGGPVTPMDSEAHVNAWLRAALAGNKDALLLDMSVHLPADWSAPDMFHYNRLTYQRAASSLESFIKVRFGTALPRL